MLTFAETIFALQIAVAGWTFCIVLLANGYLLEAYGDWLDDLPKMIGKPLGLCESCFTGQLALWTWVAFNWTDIIDQPVVAIFRLGLFIAHAILFVNVLKSVVKK